MTNFYVSQNLRARMKQLVTPFATTVGYMLKVLKANVKIEAYNEEFKMIRHGNYFEFINSVKGEVPHTVVYAKGKVTSDNIAKKDDFDFLGLFNTGPSLKKFHEECFNFYGQINDLEVPNPIYGIAALFEISVRMHANNHNLIKPREKLVDIINILSVFKNLTTDETNKLHQGRRFINMIKHFNNQFDSWEKGINALEAGYKILKDNKLTVI